MFLTTNKTVSSKRAGSSDWGYDYLYGPKTKGWIWNAWESGAYGSGVIFMQLILRENQYE